MSTLEIAVVVLATVWLAILTLVVILTVRQVGILTVRLSMTGETFSLAKDGPEIGSTLPELVKTTLPDLESAHQATVLFISATCSPCRELVAGLKGHHFSTSTIALLTGHEEVAESLAELLPSSMQLVRDPAAADMAKALSIQSTPFAIAVRNGMVAKKEYIHSANLFIEFVQVPLDGQIIKTEVDHVHST